MAAENAEGRLVTGLQEADTEGKAAQGKAEKGAHLVENAEALATGLPAEASMEKEGAKGEGHPLAEAKGEGRLVTGLQEADTEGKAAQGKAEKGAHLAEDTVEKEGAKGGDPHLAAAKGEGRLVTGLQEADTVETEGVKAGEGPPLVGENAEARLATGLPAVNTAER